MRKIKGLENQRWFIWTIVIMFVSMIGLSVYIWQAGENEAAQTNAILNKIKLHRPINRGQPLNLYQKDAVYQSGSVGFVGKQVEDVNYIELIKSANTSTQSKINNQIKQIAMGYYCFGDPSDPQALDTLQETYADTATFKGSDNYLASDELLKMTHQEIKRRLEDDFSFKSYVKIESVYQTGNILSVVMHYYADCGNAYPTEEIEGHNFDLRTGKELQFTDLFSNYSKDQKNIVQVIKDATKSNTEYSCDFTTNGVDIEKEISYSLSESGLVLESFGLAHVVQVCEPTGTIIPFAQLNKYFKPDIESSFKED